MKIEFTEAAKNGNNGSGPLQQASQFLEEVAGHSVFPITAEWDRVQDPKGKAVYALRLSDKMGTVSDKFAPNELRGGFEMRWRLRQMYGDLLQNRSQRLRERPLEGSD